MKNIWIIAKRELSAFFSSLMAYILLVIFLGFSGLFTWFIGQDVFFIKQASLQAFFNIAYWTLFFFIPGITMLTAGYDTVKFIRGIITFFSISIPAIIGQK